MALDAFELALRRCFPGKSNAGLRQKIRSRDSAEAIRGLARTVALTAQGQADLETVAVALERVVEARRTEAAMLNKLAAARRGRTTCDVVVKLKVRGAEQDALHVVDALLDAGFFQDAINDHTVDGCGPLHVKVAVVRGAEEVLPPAFTADELKVILEALDSHVYWQLSDEKYRSDGFVEDPGSDDPEQAALIVEANALHGRIEGILKTRS